MPYCIFRAIVASSTVSISIALLACGSDEPSPAGESDDGAGSTDATGEEVDETAGNEGADVTSAGDGADEPPCGVSPGAVIHVDAMIPVAGDGSTWETACRDLADAIAAAQVAPSPPEIWVADGDYGPPESGMPLVPMFAGIQLYGGFAGGEESPEQRPTPLADTQLLGANGSAVVIGADGGRLDGFVVTGPEGGMRMDDVTVTVASSRFEGCDEGAMDVRGGGVTVTDSAFVANAGHEGAGIYAEDTTLVLDNVSFTNNQAGSDGGGLSVHDSTATLTDVTLIDNFADRSGGGLASNNGTLSLRRVRIEGNHADWQGGGVYDGQNQADYFDVTFRENSSGHDGGGAYMWFTLVMVVNSSFELDSAASRGGAIGGGASEGEFINVTFRDNFVIAGGSGAAFDTSSGTFAITNAIFYGHEDGAPLGGLITVDNSCIESEVYGDANVMLDASPIVEGAGGELFVDPASPCVDAGDSAAADLAFALADLDWTTMTTDPAQTPDSGPVDAGRHY